MCALRLSGRPYRYKVSVLSLGRDWTCRAAVPERRVFESGNKAERSAPIGSNVDGAHPRGPRDPTPAGRVARRKKTHHPSCILCTLRSGGTGRSPRRSGNERASRRVDESRERHADRAVGVRLAASGDTPTIRRRARRAVT